MKLSETQKQQLADAAYTLRVLARINRLHNKPSAELLRLADKLIKVMEEYNNA